MAVVPRLDPYPPAEVIDALTRSYEIDQFTWAFADAAEAELTTLAFPQVLFSKPYLRDKLKWYSLFRSGVDITFRFNATKFMFGSFMAAGLPFYDDALVGFDAANRFRNLVSMSQCPHKIISAQQGQSVTLRIPWVHPHAWMFMDSPISEVGSMKVRVEHPLSSSNANDPTSITVTVYATFHEPDIAGYSPDAAPATMVSRKAFLAKKKQSQVAATAQSHGTMVKKGQTNGTTVQQEAEQKAKTGLLTGVVSQATDTIAPIIGTILPEAAPLVEAVGGIASMLSPIFSIFGLNKPASDQIPGPIVSRYNEGLAYGQGSDGVEKLCLDPRNVVSVKRGIVGPENPQPSILEIMQRPTRLFSGSFTAAASPGTLLHESAAVPQAVITDSADGTDVWQHSFVSWYTQMSSYWRGTLKYMLKFTTSSNVSCRVRIAHLNEPLTSALNDIGGDIVSKVADVSGDTSVPFEIRFLNNIHYVPTQHPRDVVKYGQTGCLAIFLDSPVISTDAAANTPIYWSLWQSAGPDFRLLQLRAPTLGLSTYVPPEPPAKAAKVERRIGKAKSSSVAAEAQTDMMEEFRKPFSGLVPAKYSVEAGFISGEDFGTLNNCLHRYVLRTGESAAGVTTPYVLPHFLSNGPSLQHALIAPFMFMRGSGRLYSVPDNATANVTPLGVTPNLANGITMSDLGIAYGGANFTPLRIEYPWTDFRAFVEILPTIDLERYDVVRFNRVAGTNILASVGDDFSVGVVAGLPSQYLPTPPPLLKSIVPAIPPRKMYGQTWERERATPHSDH